MPKVKDEYIDQKRKSIVEAAFRVCLQKPIASIEMTDIIKETGFSHGTIYQYYKSSDEIFRDMVIKINRENRMNEKINLILESEKSCDWKKTVKKICAGLSENLVETGCGVLKIAIYSNSLALTDPERALCISKKLGEENQSPLLFLIETLKKYLKKVVRENSLRPSKSIEQILQFFAASYQGILTGYVLSENYKSDYLAGRFKPKEMFSCLAESVILMLSCEPEVKK